MNNSREIVVSLSRERLARAVSRLERLARDAAETIANLRQEKHELETRLADLAQLFERERSNFEQGTALLQSVTNESEERGKAFDELHNRLSDRERLLNEQFETISRLDSDLNERTQQLRDRQKLEEEWQNELGEWKQKTEQLEARIKDLSSERDAMKSQLYQHEREDAHYAVRLSREEREKAVDAIDGLIEKLSTIESRMVTS